MKINNDLEELIGKIENSLQGNGYISQRYSQAGGKFGTTSYDCILVRGMNGKEYTLNIDERMKLNRESGILEPTNDLANKSINNMCFYEFDSSVFGYYALIGSVSQEEAMKHYEETIGDIGDEDSCPDEISKEDAKSKLLSVCKDSDEKYQAELDFNLNTLGKKPYLILIDGSLI